jgi:hypothetical protein
MTLSNFLKIHLNIILPSTSWSPQWPLSLRLPHQHPMHTSILPHTRHFVRLYSHKFKFICLRSQYVSVRYFKKATVKINAVYSLLMSSAFVTVVDITITLFWYVNSCCLVNRINVPDKPPTSSLSSSSSLKAIETQVSVKCR